MYFGCSKEPSYRDGSFEYPQYMFWLRNKKNNFLLRTFIWGPVNYQTSCLKRVNIIFVCLSSLHIIQILKVLFFNLLYNKVSDFLIKDKMCKKIHKIVKSYK